MIEHLGQRVCFSQVHGQRTHRSREHPFQGAGDAAKLPVALGEVVLTIELLKEEACGGRELWPGKKVRISSSEALGLQTLDGMDRLCQTLLLGTFAQLAHTSKVQTDGISGAAGGVHLDGRLCGYAGIPV